MKKGPWCPAGLQFVTFLNLLFISLTAARYEGPALPSSASCWKQQKHAANSNLSSFKDQRTINCLLQEHTLHSAFPYLHLSPGK